MCAVRRMIASIPSTEKFSNLYPHRAVNRKTTVNKVVSSANWDILCSFPQIVIPLISSCFLMDSLRSSTARTKCPYPIPKLIISDGWPFCKILDFEFFCRLLIIKIVFSLKLNDFRILEIYSHEIVSKAFFKLTKIINPDSPFNFVSCRMSKVKQVFSPMNLSWTKPFWLSPISFGWNCLIGLAHIH